MTTRNRNNRIMETLAKRGTKQPVVVLKQIPQGEPTMLKAKRMAPEGVESKVPRKRAAFGDLTNAYKEKNLKTKKGSHVPVKPSKSSKSKTSTTTTTKSLSQQSESSVDVLDLMEDSSWDLVSSQESLASSQQSNSQRSSAGSSDVEMLNERNSQQSQEIRELEVKGLCEKLGIVDIDKENSGDPFQVPEYANDIFNYYKQREDVFVVDNYFERQKELQGHMRAILVDWLVEVQENFELNHETLYLAVKLVDLYLSKKIVKRESLQLVGTTALFVACKFDERMPPCLDDFLYICDDAYEKPQLLAMERDVLKTIGFDLGIPLSYRFLRRYAKCAKATMETLTLARYVLEMSLMENKFLGQRDSKMAAACLQLALKMKKAGEWDRTLEHYTGYTADELHSEVLQLNSMIAAPPSKQLTTIRSKYSHKVFHEVAKLPALDILELS